MECSGHTQKSIILLLHFRHTGDHAFQLNKSASGKFVKVFTDCIYQKNVWIQSKCLGGNYPHVFCQFSKRNKKLKGKH